MAIRFDAETEKITTSSPINYNAAYAVLFGFRIAVDRDDFSYMLSIDDGGNSSYDSFALNGDGTTLLVEVAVPAFSGATGASLTTGTDFWGALVRTSVTEIIGYVFNMDGTLNTSATVTHGTVASRTASTRMGFNPGIWSGQWFNGRIGPIKSWIITKSQAELQQELYSILPVSFSSLYSWWPTFPGSTERLADYSGNGRNWTATGTLTDEDPPPVSWGARPLFPQLVAAAAGSAILRQMIAQHGD